MVWAGVCYGQQTQVHFIEGILNALRYRDEILRPIVAPLIHDHHLMLQHDNARPLVARICTQFLEAENIPVLAWPAYSPDKWHVTHWACLGCSGSAYTTACSSSCQYPATSHSHWRGPTFHRPQSTTWSTLCEGDVLHGVRQMVVTPDTDWFSDCTKHNNQQTQIYYQCNSSPINQLVHLYSEWYIKQKMQWATAIWKWLIELFIFLFRYGNVHVVHRFLHMRFAVLTFMVTNDLNFHLNDNRLWKFLKKNMDIPSIYSPQSSHS